MKRDPLTAIVMALAAATTACGPAEPPSTLAGWDYFDTGGGATPGSLVPAPGVLPYELAAEPFADHALRRRFLTLSRGGTIGYDDEARWTLPPGAAVIQHFAYPLDMRAPEAGERPVETRLLVLGRSGWEAHTYVWDAGGTTATRTETGARVPVSWIDATGTERSHEWLVPNLAACWGCHVQSGLPGPLALRARLVDRDHDYGDGEGPVNQIDRLAALGWLEGPPPPGGSGALPDPFGTAPLEARARAYLDVNCAHCHSPGALAGFSGLVLGWEVAEPRDYGVCRVPASGGAGGGGLTYDVVPGDPGMSIMPFRMSVPEPEVHMPEQGAVLIDWAGVNLIYDWIAAMTPAGCP